MSTMNNSLVHADTDNKNNEKCIFIANSICGNANNVHKRFFAISCTINECELAITQSRTLVFDFILKFIVACS